MEVSREIIAKLNPCTDRFYNYINHYSDKTFTKQQFMGLKHITHEDKLWVAFRLIPRDDIKLVAVDIAESVLELFESKYPNDLRPRMAIEVARNSSSDLTSAAAADAAYYAAYAAARTASNAADAAAYYAAYAAAVAARTSEAAAYAAAVAAPIADAASFAAYSAAAVAYYAASSAAAGYAAKSRQTHEKFIRKIVMKYWK